MSEYLRPRSIEEAVAIRAGRDVVVLAGGTDIYPARTARAAWGQPWTADILDISAIAELRGVMERPDHWRIGALTTWSELARTPLPPQFDGLRAAAREVGGAQVQNRGTIAGNICTASPAGDGIPCLLSLDASVELVGPAGTRHVPIVDFVTGYRRTTCRPDEIVSAVLIPRSPARGAFVKLGARRYLVISIVMAAATVTTDETGRVASARIAVGACGPRAIRLPALEAALAGRRLGEVRVEPGHFDGLSPIDDVRASASYRQSAARQVVADCLAQLAAEGGA